MLALCVLRSKIERANERGWFIYDKEAEIDPARSSRSSVRPAVLLLDCTATVTKGGIKDEGAVAICKKECAAAAAAAAAAAPMDG